MATLTASKLKLASRWRVLRAICGDQPDTSFPCQVQEEPQSALRRACNIILSQNAEASKVHLEVRNSDAKPIFAFCTRPSADVASSPFRGVILCLAQSLAGKSPLSTPFPSWRSMLIFRNCTSRSPSKGNGSNASRWHAEAPGTLKHPAYSFHTRHAEAPGNRGTHTLASPRRPAFCRHSDEIEASQKQQTSSAGSAAAHTREAMARCLRINTSPFNNLLPARPLFSSSTCGLWRQAERDEGRQLRNRDPYLVNVRLYLSATER